jgi:hypothetical protein
VTAGWNHGAETGVSPVQPGRGAQLSTSKLFLCWCLVLWNGRWCGRCRCRWLRLCLGLLYTRKHGGGSGSPSRKDRKRDRRDHKNDRGPGRRPGKNRCRAPRPKCSLATLTAESRGQVPTLPALQQHDSNQKKANDNVNYYNQNGHCKKTPSGPRPDLDSDLPSAISVSNAHESVRWCGRGDLNPHAFRRHPLKMVCLPVPPLPL